MPGQKIIQKKIFQRRVYPDVLDLFININTNIQLLMIYNILSCYVYSMFSFKMLYDPEIGTT